jgi:plastocyanin
MRPITLYVLCTAIGAAAGCGGGGDDDGGTAPPTVATVTVSPPEPDTLFGIGETVALAAVARTAAGDPVSGTAISFASQNEGIASVTGAGLVQAVAAGATTVTASAGAVTSAPVPIRVRQKFTALTLEAPSATVIVGGTLQFTASARDAAGAAIDGLPAPTFASSEPSVAVVGVATGRLTALTEGQTTITASLTSPVDGTLSSARQITITAPPATASVATGPGNVYNPPSVTIAPGGTVTFTLGAAHNAVFEGTGIGGLDFGATGSRSFSTPGTYRFRCQAHSNSFTSGMTGSVVVQ